MHSDRVSKIIERYEALANENKNLRDRVNKLIAQHDVESQARKLGQINQADRDMQLLQASRLRRNNESIG